MLCTSVDSERTSIPSQSAVDYQQLLDQCKHAAKHSPPDCITYRCIFADSVLLTKLHIVSTTAVSSATVSSFQMVRHVKLDALANGVLPWNESSTRLGFGTTLGSSFFAFLPFSSDLTGPL
jgi:hypothetical protein